MPTSEYARAARSNVYDDIDLADDEIAQKLKEMRPRKVFTVDSDDEIEDDDQDKVGSLIQTSDIFQTCLSKQHLESILRRCRAKMLLKIHAKSPQHRV